MDPTIKNLCNCFHLTGINWLPSSVEYLFYYFLDHPDTIIDGDVLFLHISEETIDVQLLTIIASKGEIIVEKPAVFFCGNDISNNSLSSFLQDQLIHYGTDLGILSNGLWNIEKVLLVTDDPEKDINLDFFGNAVQMISLAKNLHIHKECTGNYEGPAFTSISIIYSNCFYIERKKNTEPITTELISLPFANDLLALNISSRYKIFSITADSEYNLAENRNFIHVKLFEKEFIQRKTAEQQPKLILDHTEEINGNQTVINIYFNLASTRLELECTADHAGLSSDGNFLQELQNKQQSGYDFIKNSQLLNAQLISDIDLHLRHQNISDPSKYTSKTVYYRALSLLSLLSSKK